MPLLIIKGCSSIVSTISFLAGHSAVSLVQLSHASKTFRALSLLSIRWLVLMLNKTFNKAFAWLLYFSVLVCIVWEALLTLSQHILLHLSHLLIWLIILIIYTDIDRFMNSCTCIHLLVHVFGFLIVSAVMAVINHYCTNWFN